MMMAEMRDLKADLEKLKSHEENDVRFMSLVKYNKFLVAKVLNKQKRSKQLEALARELVEAVEEAIWLLESYTGRHEDIERLAKELVKAKEVLGDE